MLSVVILGASGDLARRKTYPALFGLFVSGLLPENFQIIGYARSALGDEEFKNRLVPFLKNTITASLSDFELLAKFLAKCFYIHGLYDTAEGFQAVAKMLSDAESSEGYPGPPHQHIRLFYLALPPTIFVPVARQLRQHVYDERTSVRIVVEKPFGKDSESSTALATSLAPLFSEKEIFRIDHYLGKEMIKNLIILRFYNLFFTVMWSRQYIDTIQIVFKETLGAEGRGGYFDEFGIIRDVMQNHLLQILTVVAMERPLTMDAEDVRDEKVRVLRAIKPLHLSDVILGQYGPSPDGSKRGYREDKTIAASSNTPTFAMAALYVRNERWDGVPFIIRCGKALNEKKAEIRIQFRDVPGIFVGADQTSRNELVIRVQPDEAVYLKMVVKRPGLTDDFIVSDLDLSYSQRYSGLHIPDAYESLLLDIFRNDHSNFVRDDELKYAWDIFTPLLHEIDRENVVPIQYPYGSRGPTEVTDRIAELGYRRHVHEYFGR